MSCLSVEAGALMPALRRVLSAVKRKPTIPILATVQLASSDGELTVAATNLDMEIRAHLPAVGELPAVCVNPHVLVGMLKGLPASEPVTLEAENAALRVRIGDERWNLPAMPAEDWPTMSGPPQDQPSLSLDAGWIGDALARVSPFISTEETRYYLNGVLLEAEGDKLMAVATNGHQLGRVERIVPGAATTISAAGFTGTKSCIIPRDMVRAILAHMRGPVTVTLSSAPLVCRWEGDGLAITGKLIDGTYPDYRRVIDEPKDCGYEIDRLAFLSALARLKALASRGGERGVYICWRQGRLVLERQDVELGTASIPVPGTTLATWPAIPLCFNYAYLAAAAQQVRGAALRVHNSGAAYAQACIVDVSDPASTFVIMPMRGDVTVPHDLPPAQKAA